MNYAIIEDEPFARDSLQRTMERLYPNYNLAFKCATITDSIRNISENKSVDLIFMDVELADGNCFEIFKNVNVTAPVVFTTSYEEFAIQAFKVHSIDYLLKPFSEADLSLAIAKFERLNGKRNAVDYSNIAAQSSRMSRIRIESGGNYCFVGIEEVAFFISEDKYVMAQLKNGKRVMTSFLNLQEAEEMLDPSDFFRLSRNVIASISSIKNVSKFFRGRLLVRLQYEDKTEEVTVSSNRREEFLNWLGR